jgi:predicted nucleotidyltransferase component of viral defense system
MKDYLRQQVNGVQDVNIARSIIREYLQARTLESLQDNNAFVNWAFVGGTALRFLYSLPRFSEDLEFSTAAPGLEDNFVPLMQKIKKQFLAEGYSVSIKAKAAKTVKAAFIKFDGLLYELGLSPHRSEVISIKIDIDTNPPIGAKLETSIIRKHCLLNLQHYDKSSLLAGKLHALLMRKYTKGRDIYDLLWYLSDKTWPEPNIDLLNNALKQTPESNIQLTSNNWQQHVAERIEQLDWEKVIADVKPFIEKQSDVQLLTKENLIKILTSYSR